MNLQEIYEKGYAVGVSLDPVFFLPFIWEESDMKDAVKLCLKDHKENYQKNVPSDQFVADINSQPNAEILWEEYNRGVSEGINKFSEWWLENCNQDSWLIPPGQEGNPIYEYNV